MIFIIAGSYKKAKQFAKTQMLTDDEWISTLDLDDLRQLSNFHVIVTDSASELNPSFFEKVFNLALIRGRIGRK